jgi:hypothetical protein
MKISFDVTHLQTSNMSIIDNQSLTQLRDEIRSLRRDLIVICQQQTQTHQLIQQQHSQFHQLMILLLRKDSSLDSHNAPASATMPSFSFPSYNFSNPSQSSLTIATPQNTSFTENPDFHIIPNRDSCPSIQRPEPAYPVVNPTAAPSPPNPPMLGILPLQMGDATKKRTQIRKPKRSRVTTKKDDTVEKDRVEQNQNQYPISHILNGQ